MGYVVHYTIKHKENSVDFEEACFGSVGYQLYKIKPKPTKDTKLIYHYKKAKVLYTDDVNRQYLEFLNRIPEFSPYIDVDKILNTGEWEFPLNAPRIHFCVLASLIRAMVEEPQIVKLCAFIEQHKLYDHIKTKHNLTEIGILQVCGVVSNNIGHWVSKNPAKILNVLDNTYWLITDTMSDSYFGDVHLTFNCYSGYFYLDNLIGLNPILDNLTKDLKLSFGYKP